MTTSAQSITHLEVQKRIPGNKYATKKMHTEYLLPAVIYGPAIKENVIIVLDYITFERMFAVNGRHIPLILSVDKVEYKVIIKDYTIDPISRRFIHVDFYNIIPNHEYSTLVPIEYTGTPIGVREGGSLLTYVRKVHIRGTLETIPTSIHTDISHVQRKKNITVRNLEIPEICKILTNKGTVVMEVK